MRINFLFVEYNIHLWGDFEHECVEKVDMMRVLCFRVFGEVLRFLACGHLLCKNTFIYEERDRLKLW
jgi:hypothetical protein